MIKVVYFASIRERLGVDEESIDLGAITKVSELVSLLTQRGAPWDDALSGAQLLVAVNQEMSPLDAGVTDGDEVAFFPPVTGG